MKCKRCGEKEAQICTRCANDIQDFEEDANAARIKALELRAEALETALRKLESVCWVLDYDGIWLCNECGFDRDDEHGPDCPFAALRGPGAGEEGE